MSLGFRKIIVVGTIIAVLLLANASLLVSWLQESGLVPLANHVRSEYLTGTAITVIAAFLILIPGRTVWAICVRRCRVCNALDLQRGKYCCRCGSRV